MSGLTWKLSPAAASAKKRISARVRLVEQGWVSLRHYTGSTHNDFDAPDVHARGIAIGFWGKNHKFIDLQKPMDGSSVLPPECWTPAWLALLVLCSVHWQQYHLARSYLRKAARACREFPELADAVEVAGRHYIENAQPIGYSARLRAGDAVALLLPGLIAAADDRRAEQLRESRSRTLDGIADRALASHYAKKAARPAQDR